MKRSSVSPVDLGTSMDIVITIAAIGTLLFTCVAVNGLVSVGFQAIAHTRLQQFSDNLVSLRKTLRSLLLALCIGLCLLVGAVNGFLMYQGKPVLGFYRDWLQRIPQEFWLSLVIAVFKCICLLLLVKLSLPYLRRSLNWVCCYAQNSLSQPAPP
jgi:small conductance mechanosensitive channel